MFLKMQMFPLQSAHFPPKMLTCIATGKSSWKSGGKKRSACFLEKPGFPTTKQSIRKMVISVCCNVFEKKGSQNKL
jgi:hypothetical protein